METWAVNTIYMEKEFFGIFEAPCTLEGSLNKVNTRTTAASCRDI